MTLLVAHGAGALRLRGEKLRPSATEYRLNLLKVGVVEAQRFSEGSVAAGPAFLLLISTVEMRVNLRQKVALRHLWHAKGRVSVLEVRPRLKTVVDQPHRLLQGVRNGRQHLRLDDDALVLMWASRQRHDFVRTKDALHLAIDLDRCRCERRRQW